MSRDRLERDRDVDFEEAWRDARERANLTEVPGCAPHAASINSVVATARNAGGTGSGSRLEVWSAMNVGEGKPVLALTLMEPIVEHGMLAWFTKTMTAGMGPDFKNPPPRHLVDMCSVFNSDIETNWRRRNNIWPTGYQVPA